MSKEQEWKEQLERSARKSRWRGLLAEGPLLAGGCTPMIVLVALPALWLVV
jgi:hypothetical protein